MPVGKRHSEGKKAEKRSSELYKKPRRATKKVAVRIEEVNIQREGTTVWHEICAGSKGIFAIFPAIRKNMFPQIKITTNIFPAKFYSGVNIL